MELKKSDIVLVQAPSSPSGTEIQKTRPAVVISPKEMAIHGNRVLVVPITSNISIRTVSSAIEPKTLRVNHERC